MAEFPRRVLGSPYLTVWRRAARPHGATAMLSLGQHREQLIGAARTVAGDPRRPRAPLLRRPIGVAVNADGDLYGADPEVGLMRIVANTAVNPASNVAMTPR